MIGACHHGHLAGLMKNRNVPAKVYWDYSHYAKVIRNNENSLYICKGLLVNMISILCAFNGFMIIPDCFPKIEKYLI